MEGLRTQPGRPFSQACEENKRPILGVLSRVLADTRRVLELGSGTGQHAVFFAAELPHLTWQTSDVPALHPGIRGWLAVAGLANVPAPLALDVTGPWPAARYDGVFSANTTHIMDWSAVQALFRGVGRVLEPGGVFVLYGPFSYGGRHTSESNARFDAYLKARDPGSGIRDFQDLDALALENGLSFWLDAPMPVHNRTLVWRRRDQPPTE